MMVVAMVTMVHDGDGEDGNEDGGDGDDGGGDGDDG
jgi:hypothetical protein